MSRVEWQAHVPLFAGRELFVNPDESVYFSV